MLFEKALLISDYLLPFIPRFPFHWLQKALATEGAVRGRNQRLS
jgi:hypothetical protein